MCYSRFIILHSKPSSMLDRKWLHLSCKTFVPFIEKKRKLDYYSAAVTLTDLGKVVMFS